MNKTKQIAQVHFDLDRGVWEAFKKAVHKRYGEKKLRFVVEEWMRSYALHRTPVSKTKKETKKTK